jgi:uncharacterized membrane protein
MQLGLLIAGIVAWSAMHLFPAVLPGARLELVDRLGRGPWRGLFSLVIISSLVLIVFGWRSSVPDFVYTPPLAGSPVPAVLVLIAFVLFVAARVPSNIKRMLRHPQLTGLILWVVAHLLANGDSRSIALFGGLGCWALAEIVLINRRDGAWERPDARPILADVIVVIAAAFAFALVLYFHERLFGVPPIAA